MASFTAGTTFVDGVANDVTAAKLGTLVTNATPTSGLIQDRTAETVVATNDTFLIGDASDSNTLKRMTVANVMKAEHTGTINTTAGTITTLNSTTGTITGLNSTNGTVATLNSTTGTITGLNSTNGTVATLNSTTGTITGLNSTNGTVATLNSTTGTIGTLVATGTITGSTNVVNIGSGQIYKDATGNIGIGTTSPSRKLSIVSSSADSNLTLGTNSPSLSLTNEAVSPNAATQTGIIALATSPGAFGLSSGDLLIGMIGTSRGDLYLNSNFSGTGTTDVILQPTTGNVGIGDSTPAAKLDVNGSFNATSGTIATFNSTTGTIATLNSTTGTIATLNSTTGTIATLNSTTGTIPTLVSTTLITTGTGTAAAPAIVPTGDTNTGVFFPAADTIAFSEGATEAMRINSSGNVSIGTATALSKLHVHGDLTMSNATTAVTASTGGVAIPATVAGYLTVSINGTSRKIPYFAT